MDKYEFNRRMSYYYKSHFHSIPEKDYEISEEEFIEKREAVHNGLNEILIEHHRQAEIPVLDTSLDVDEIRTRIIISLNLRDLKLAIPNRLYNDEEYLFILSQAKESERTGLFIKNKLYLSVDMKG